MNRNSLRPGIAKTTVFNPMYRTIMGKVGITFCNLYRLKKKQGTERVVHLSTMRHLCLQIGQGGHLGWPNKHKLGRGCWNLAVCQVSFNSVQRFQRSRKFLARPIRGRGRHLVFPIGPKNTNLVEDIEFLLHVKFYQIPISRFRKVENVSANQRPG